MQKCIVVLGMHRSGTSALMGVLNLLGINLGSNLLLAVEDNNPKGFFENNYVFEVNEKVLSSLNSSWDDLFFSREDWWKQESISVSKDKIIEIIKKEFNGTEVFGIKDPRMCILLPIWNSVLEELNIKPYYIISLRNPLEIADSLKKRDGFSIEKGILLWMSHMLYAESYSRGFRRVFTLFDDLLMSPERTINHISNVLDINLPKTYQEVKNDIKRLLDPSLKHHNYKTDDSNNVILPLVMHYYQILLSMTYAEEIGEEDLLKIDKIRKSYNEIHKVFYNQDIKELTTLERVVREKDSLLQEQARQMQAKELQISEIKKVPKDKDYHLRSLERLVRVKDQYIRNLEKSVEIKDSSISNLETMVRDRDLHIADISRQLQEKDAILNDIYNSRGWRALMVYSRIKERVLPQGSWQRALVRSVVNFSRLHVGERNKNRR